MKILGIKLVDLGRGGMVITTEENVMKGGVSVVDLVDRKRKLPVSSGLSLEIGKLTEWLLKMMMMWRPEFDDVYDPETGGVIDDSDNVRQRTALKDVLDRVSCTGFKKKGDRICLTGQVLIGEKYQCVGFATPFVGIDDLEYYGDLEGAVDSVKRSLKAYLESDKLDFNARQYMLKLYDNKEENMAGKTDAELEQEAIDLLSQKGFVVISTEEVIGVESAGDGNTMNDLGMGLPGIPDESVSGMIDEGDDDEEKKGKKKNPNPKDKFMKDTF